MGADNFVTMGKIYKTVMDKERRFEYNGEDVEAIPYITDEIISRINNVSRKKNADIVIIELGGTAGEYQNVFYYEASRMMTLKKPQDVIHIHVSYVPTPGHLGEPKTKPTQLSVRTLNSMGIQPDFIVTRGEKYLDQRRKDRLALFCNVHKDDIISSPDVPSVYQIPLVLHEQELDKKIMKKLGLPFKKPNLKDWIKFVESTKNAKKSIEIAIVGKYFGTGEYELRDSYAALFDAIDHAGWRLGLNVKKRWINAEKVEKDGLENIIGKPDGIIVPIGWGERGAEGMIAAASYARVNSIPYLGLCYGMQLSVISYARDILGFKDADSEENKKTKHPVIHFIPKQKELIERRSYGGTMRLGGWDAKVKSGTIAYSLYEKYNGFKNKEKSIASERHRHRYEFNDDFTKDFEKNGLIISARSIKENLVEITELSKDKHPFFLGTQGHPEYKSRPLMPHPIFLGFLEACK
jgi:CTP synthase